ncbi:hypothetical protein [Agathobaculum hominis]
MTSVNGWVKKNRRILLIVGAFLSIQLIYLSNATANTPLMDYWYYINDLLPSLFREGVSFAQLWNNAGIHRSPLQLMFFLVNAKYFHLNIQLEVYAGAFVIAVTAIILFFYAKAYVLQGGNKQLFWLCATIIFTLYNANQYELLTEQFALSYSIRMLLFVLGMMAVDRYVCQYNKRKGSNIEIGCLCFVTVELVGGGYFPAYLIAIWSALLVGYFIMSKQNGKEYIKSSLVIVVSGILAIIVYLYGVEFSKETANYEVSITKKLYELIIGILRMWGTCLVGTQTIPAYTTMVGGIFCIISVITIYFYCKLKKYKQSVLPICFYLYSLSVMGLVAVGRSSMYGEEYAFMSRYTCETNLSIIAMILMIAAVIMNNNRCNRILKRTLCGCLLGIVLCGVFSTVKEYKIAPYRREYGMQLIDKMQRVDELSDSDFDQFQAKGESVRNGIDIMQEYHLGVFRY